MFKPITPAKFENITRPRTEIIGMEKCFKAGEPPKLSGLSCMNLNFDDDIFNPKLVPQNAERLNDLRKKIQEMKHHDEERLRLRTNDYLKTVQNLKETELDILKISEKSRQFEKALSELEQQTDLERKKFYTDVQASQAEKNELLIQNSNLDAEKLELVEEKIYLKNKQILSAENEELFHKLSIEKNKTKEMISIIEKLELEINQFQQEEQDESSQISIIQIDAMQNISRKEESAQNTFTQMHEEISYANDLTIITKYGGQNEKAIDCPVTSSVISSTLMTNDMSELMTADNTECLTTFGQQQTTNKPNFFALQHSETDEISNLFRMKKSSSENTNINKECMCANNNASKKRVVSFQEFFRKIKMGFGSTSSSSSIKRTGDSKETNGIISRVVDDNAKIVKTKRQPKLLMFKKKF